jgi:hypothetical protein
LTKPLVRLRIQKLQFSRIQEGGFRLVMGRAGMNTNRGYFPFGTMITKGIYVIENEPTPGVNHELEYQSFVPLHSNHWATGYIVNDVYRYVG